MKETLSVILITAVFNGVFALTSGPTQPEYSGFTPSDLPSMVDLYTGDFTYSIPLFEVPGPELSYPLTLGYRAGVQLEQEASWVGLGWCLNVGAINRSINRYPDDYWKGKSKAVLKAQDEISGWDASIGITYNNIGLAVNFGERSDQGWHWGLDLSVMGQSFGILKHNERDNWNNLTLHEDSDFGMVMNMVTGLGDRVASIAANNALENNHIDLKGASLSLNKGGASVGSKYGSFGFSSTSTHVGAFHVTSYGISLGKNINRNLSVGGSYRQFKYWLHKEDEDYLYGYLYLGDNFLSEDGSDDYKTQNHKMEYVFVPEMSRKELTGYNDFLHMFSRPKAFAMSTPDGFFATAEGLSLDFRAYRQDIGDYFGMDRNEAPVPDWFTWIDSQWWHFLCFWLDRGEIINEYNRVVATNPTHFVNMLDSYADYYDDSKHGHGGDNLPLITFRQSGDPGGTFVGEGWRPPAVTTPTTADVDYILNYRRRGTAGYRYPYMPRLDDDELVYSDQDNTLAAKDRISGSSGVFPVFAAGDATGRFPAKALIGFRVVRPDGMTYEYTKPVLNFFSKTSACKRPSEKNERDYDHMEFGDLTNSTTMERTYAYTFLLEAVKGPDFIDINDNDIVDDRDIGSWIRFNYDESKHITSYNYRTPYTGVAPLGVSRDKRYRRESGGDLSFSTYGDASWGVKEIYYLTDIYSPTHHAHFALTDRDDGREAVLEDDNFSGELTNDQQVAWITTSLVPLINDELEITFNDSVYFEGDDITEPGCVYGSSYSGRRVVVTSIDEQNPVAGYNYNGNMLLRKIWIRPVGFTFPTYDERCHKINGTRIKLIKRASEPKLQKVDRVDLYPRASDGSDDGDPLKSVVFTYENDVTKQLCPGIPNSYSSKGKLTLREVKIGVNSTFMPPYQFAYYKEGDEARYNQDNWDKWGYYKHDGNLVPVKFTNSNIARLDNILALVRDPSNDRGGLLRTQLRKILNNNDYLSLFSAGPLLLRQKEAIGRALDILREDTTFFKNNRNDRNIIPVDNVSNDYYPSCKQWFEFVTKSRTGPIPSKEYRIMATDGTLRTDPPLETWEVNAVQGFNMALISEMIFVDPFTRTSIVTDDERMVMKHLEVNRFDHEPNKEDVNAWSLKSVCMPSGSNLTIELESDDYSFIGHCRAVDPVAKEGIVKTPGNIENSDLGYYKYIGLEKDLITGNDLLRIGGYEENNMDVIAQDGTRAFKDIEIRVVSLFRVWRDIARPGQPHKWELNEDFKKLKEWRDAGKTNGDAYGLQLLALFDPNVLSSFMVMGRCVECGKEEETTNSFTRTFVPIPINLGNIKPDEFELDDPGTDGEFACQWKSVSFRLGDLEVPEKFEDFKVYDNGNYKNTCSIVYFNGLMPTDCGGDQQLFFPKGALAPDQKDKTTHFQYDLVWARKVDFNSANDVTQNIPSTLQGLDVWTSDHKQITQINGLNIREAAQQGKMLNCYKDNNGLYKGYFSYRFLQRLGVSSAYDEPIPPNETDPDPIVFPFRSKFWDYHSIITAVKRDDPDIGSSAPGIVGGGIRVKRLSFNSGWPVRPGQPPLTRVSEYLYQCEADQGKPGNYSSGSTASEPPPFNNQGESRIDVSPQAGMIQGAPKVCYRTVHEIRPGRGKIVYNFLTPADISDYFADDSANYYKYNAGGAMEPSIGAYNVDGVPAYHPVSSHHRWILHRCSQFQGLMKNERKYDKDGTLMAEKKLRYLTSLTRNDICNLDMIGKINYLSPNLGEVLVAADEFPIMAGNKEHQFTVHPLSENLGEARERVRMRWLNCDPDAYGKDLTPKECIGLNEVEIIEHSIHQYSVQTKIQGVGTKSINSYFDFVTGEPIVSTIMEADHENGDEQCIGCGTNSDPSSPTETQTITPTTTVTVPANWISTFTPDHGISMASAWKDPLFRISQQTPGFQPGDMKNKNLLTQPYSVSTYSGLPPYPSCCDGEREKWVRWLSNDVRATEIPKPLFKRTVTTWQVYPGKYTWQKNKELELRAPMNADKTIDAAPTSLRAPNDPAMLLSPLYICNSENVAFDDWNRILEIKDANGNSVSSFYDNKNGVETEGKRSGLYLIGQVANSKRSSCAVLTADDIADNGTSISRLPDGWSTMGTVTLDKTTPARSGAVSLLVNSNGSIKLSLPSATSGKKYEISFWVRIPNGKGTYTLPGGTPQNIDYIRGKHLWQVVRKQFTLSGSADIEIKCTENAMNLDDIRFAPADAQITTITYDRNGWMTTYAGPDDNISYFRYDSYGRLMEIKDHEGVIVSTQARQDAR